MKILILSDLWTPFPGGAERYIANLGNELLKRGHEIHVLTSYERAKGDPGINLVYKSIGIRKENAAGWKLISEHIQSVKPDVILVHHLFAYEFEKIYEQNIPVVQLVHSLDRQPKAKLAIFNSQFTAKGHGYKQGDLVILPPPAPDVVAASYGKFIGFVKPIAHKGAEFIYNIVPQLPEFQFLILRGEWQNIEIIENHPNVTFMQPVDDIREFYSLCRIVLMPSLAEDAGTIPQECALNCIPCISTNVGGLPETNGGIVLPYEEIPFIEAIRKLNDNRYYDTITTKQLEHVERYDWKSKFDELDRRIRNV